MFSVTGWDIITENSAFLLQNDKLSVIDHSVNFGTEEMPPLDNMFWLLQQSLAITGKAHPHIVRGVPPPDISGDGATAAAAAVAPAPATAPPDLLLALLDSSERDRDNLLKDLGVIEGEMGLCDQVDVSQPRPHAREV